MKYLMTIWPDFPAGSPQSDSFVKKQIEIETKYEGYIKRQFDAVKKLKDQEKKKIPPDFDYNSVPGLSNELKSKAHQDSAANSRPDGTHSRHDRRRDLRRVDHDEKTGANQQF